MYFVLPKEIPQPLDPLIDRHSGSFRYVHGDRDNDAELVTEGIDDDPLAAIGIDRTGVV